jgi:hypothetical protein
MARTQDLTPPELQVLDTMEGELLAGTGRERPTGPLYHYARPGAFADIVRSRQLWATHLGFLGDRRELLQAEMLIREEADRLLAVMHDESLAKAFLQDFLQLFPRGGLSAAIDVGVYLASFCEDGDHPSRWRAQHGPGQDAPGYAIGFRELPLPPRDLPEPQARLHLVRCIYDEEVFRKTARLALLEVARTFENVVLTNAQRDQTAEAFYRAAMSIGFRRLGTEIPRLKHRSFASEGEWRLVVLPARGREREMVQFRTDTSASGPALVPYIAVLAGFADDGGRLRLDRVMVGPGPEHAAEHAHGAARLLMSYGGYDTTSLLRASHIPYRAR